MTVIGSGMGTIVWAMNTLAWLFSKLVWLALLLVGMFFVLLMTARMLMAGEPRIEYWGVGLFFAAFIPISIPELVNPTALKHRHTFNQPHVPITIRRSWWATGARAAGLLMMALVCGSAIASGIEDGFRLGLAVAGVVVFALAALSLIRLQLIVSLALSPEGLDYSSFRSGPIPWQDIESVDVVRVLRSDVVALRLRDEEDYYQRGTKRLARWARFVAATPFMLPDAMFDVSPEWLRHAIQIRLDYSRTASKPLLHAVERQGTH
jgi:hypothetical protein